MRAAILTKLGEPLEIGHVTIPGLDVGQVLVKVEVSGICGSQLNEISGAKGEDAYLPHLLGHEGSGIVEEIGLGVKKVKTGDSVVLHWRKGSGIDSSPPKYLWNDTVVNAGWVTTFNEYAVVSENRVTPIPQDLDFEAAAMLGCAVTSGLGIIWNDAKVQPGQSVVVFGAGGLGLNVLQGAALVNAYPILAIDMYDTKLEMAKAFGATHTLNSAHQDPLSFIKELSHGSGIDAVIDTTGNTIIRQMAYEVTGPTGTTVYAGVPHHKEKISIDSLPLHFGRTLTGSHGGDADPDKDIPRYIQLSKRDKIKLKELITHRFPLEEINDALQLIRSGEAGRCVIRM